MHYSDVMAVLSQCGLGALLIDADSMILSANEAAGRLLHREDGLEAKFLSDFAPELVEDSDGPVYVNVAFGKYLRRCQSPDAEGMPPGARLLVFREATNEACHDVLMDVLNQVSEAVIICDAKNRI